jgi:hypothetical protein
MEVAPNHEAVRERKIRGAESPREARKKSSSVLIFRENPRPKKRTSPR